MVISAVCSRNGHLPVQKQTFGENKKMENYYKQILDND